MTILAQISNKESLFLDVQRLAVARSLSFQLLSSSRSLPRERLPIITPKILSWKNCTIIIAHFYSDELQPVSVVGLGMNAEELAANPRLSDRLQHDLNRDTTLPFSDALFDAVICTVSVEYLKRPLEIFREVNQVLKPGGLFINTFSNRWFPPKVTALWVDLHEFERMGLVGEYYLCAGGFDLVHTWSQQGMKRPDQDRYGTQLAWSDPLYAVWSHKQIS